MWLRTLETVLPTSFAAISGVICSCFDQPNHRIRTRMSGGVGGGSREATPYPYICQSVFQTQDYGTS